jgi:hypothetical protein
MKIFLSNGGINKLYRTGLKIGSGELKVLIQSPWKKVAGRIFGHDVAADF